MNTLRDLWRALGVDAAVLLVMALVLLAHPDEWSQFVIDWVVR